MYAFQLRGLPGPGTGNAAFMPATSLPRFVAGGPGVSYYGGMKAIQEPQTYFQKQQTIEGMAGQNVGAFNSQGLIDWDKYIDNLTGARGG